MNRAFGREETGNDRMRRALNETLDLMRTHDSLGEMIYTLQERAVLYLLLFLLTA